MANIPQYNSDAVLRPDDTGARALDRVARSYSSYGNEAGAAIAGIGREAEDVGNALDKHFAMQEISHGSANLAQLQDGLVQNWNQTATQADPNDPTTAANWREKSLEPAIEKWSQGFGTKAGQQWALGEADRLRQHMYEKTAADMSTIQGNVVKQNFEGVVASASNTALRDPSSVDLSLGTAESALGAVVGTHPNLTADQASALQTEGLQNARKTIIKAGAIGTANMNPSMLPGYLEKFKSDLTGEDQEALAKYAMGITREQASEARAAQAEQERQAKQAGAKSLTEITVQNTGSDGQLNPGAGYFSQLRQATMANPTGISAEEFRAASAAGNKVLEDQSNRTLMQDNPATFNDFSKRALLADGDPHKLSATEVYGAYLQGNLSNKSMTVLLDAARQEKTDPAKTQSEKTIMQFLEAMKSSITKSNPLMGQVDQTGDQRFYQFEYDARQALAGSIAQGKTLPEAMDALFNPQSKTYWGNQIPNYATSMKTSQSQVGKFVSGAGQVAAPVAGGGLPTGGLVAPRVAGESAADYLKRTQGK